MLVRRVRRHIAGQVGTATIEMDPSQVGSLEELAAAFNTLRGDRTYAELRRAAHSSPSLPDLPSSTLSDLLKGRSVPSPHTVRVFLMACGQASADQQRPWLDARERIAMLHQRRSGAATRVRDARPRVLGVHAAIQVDPDAVAGDELPAYVRRDVDDRLRTAIAEGAAGGGFVLLVGGSSVGKTRSLFEAVRAVLPEWWLLHPADTASLLEFADNPTPRTVVWLDELQRYLNGPSWLPAATLRDLINAGVIVLATMWPDEHAVRIASRVPGQPDAYANDRELLGLATVIAVADDFSEKERRVATSVAATDRRIMIALNTSDAGLTQVLAAGPELVRWWEHAADPYGKAVITAALDARRVGAHAPLTEQFLAAAAPAYLTTVRQATAPTEWLRQALTYASTPLRGAASALAPVAAAMGQVAGYTAADYLHQHALRIRRGIHLPAVVWEALLAHHHPADATRIAANAERRGRYDLAEHLYRRQTENDSWACRGLIRVLAKQGQPRQALAVRPPSGSSAWFDSVPNLAEDLISDGYVEEGLALWAEKADHMPRFGRAEVGFDVVSIPLADTLARLGRVDDLRQRANHDWNARERLAELLADQGNVDELRAQAVDGDWYAKRRLFPFLARSGRTDELRQYADEGDGHAAAHLLVVLLNQQRQDEFLQELQRRETGPGATEMLEALRWLLKSDVAQQGDIDELRRRAAEDGSDATLELVDRLWAIGQHDEALDWLRRRAEAGDWKAAERLCRRLAELGLVDELRHRADNGDLDAPEGLAPLLAKLDLVDELRQRADNGDGHAANALVAWLVEKGRVKELSAEAAAGTPGAARALRRLTGLAEAP
jgi:hypothetical protein